MNDTIAAQATPPGRGGIGIIRVSGPQVQEAINAILRTRLIPRQAVYLPFYNAANEVIDEGIALFFPAPHSFTGEDVLELQGHGGPVVMDMLLQTLVLLGIRLARPGEFSERAFLNDKLDLAQAEAIADLIDASSQQAAKLALRSLQGVFSQEIQTLTNRLIHLRMYMEAAIDFTDEEIDFLSDSKIHVELNALIAGLNHIQANAKQGSFLREGISAVIIGEPNVGKSSLLNKLSGKEVAIVTDIPGTTRDVLRDYILIDGLPVHILDTAGLRESQDIVEQEGIRRAHQALEQADLVLYVYDASGALPVFDKLPVNAINRPVIFVRNKVDKLAEPASITEINGHLTVSLSAQTGVGIDLLRAQIKQTVGFCAETEGLFLARRRHLDALARASAHIQHCIAQLASTRSFDLAAEDLRLAQLALNEITGEFTADDLLGKIFSSFCIGK